MMATPEITRQPEPIPPSQSGRGALDVSIDAARRAGEIMRERFHTEKQISF